MNIVKVDAKNRIRIPKKLTKKIGLRPGDKLLIHLDAFKLQLIPINGKKFEGSLDGLNFKEEEHEASKFLFKTGAQ